MNSARFIALRVALLVALAFSAMLAVDATSTVGATFCAGEHTGCEAVKLSPLAAPFGIPLAYLGLGVFAYLMVISFGGPKVAPIFRLSLLAAGAGGVFFLAYQWLAIGAFCELCVVVDVAAVVAAAVGLPKNLSFPAPPGALPVGAWLLLSALAIASPGLYHKLPEPRPVPDFVRELRADEGLTIVEVADFGCRHCRTIQRSLAAAVEGREDIVVKRVIVPITSHRLSRSAAAVYRCAERYGVEDELALLLADDELFGAGVERWIAELSETEGDIRACMIEKEIRDAIARDRRVVRGADIGGIPMTYVGETALRGAVSEERIARAIRLESLGLSMTRPSPFVFAGLVALAALLILIPAVAIARRRSRVED